MNLSEDEIKTHVDMGRVIGTLDVVDVDETDDIIYALRQNCEADGLVPFTKNRQGQPCRTVAMHLVKQEDGSYVLSSTWIGTFGGDDEPFPCSPDATARSASFWSKHAFIWGSQPLVTGTETSNRPW